MAYLKTYKFEMYPNNIQKRFLSCHFGACRMLYNNILSETLPAYIEWDNERKEFYKDDNNRGKKFNDVKQKPPCTRNSINSKETAVSSVSDYRENIKDDNGICYLKEYDSIALNMVLDRVENAYKAYENPNMPDAGLPRYKKRGGYQSFKTSRQVSSLQDKYDLMNGNLKVDVDNKCVLLPKFNATWKRYGEKPGWIKTVMHRDIVIKNNPCEVKSATVTLTPEGKYFISLLVSYVENPYAELKKTNKRAGVSFAIAQNSLVVSTDDGYKYLKGADLEKLRRIDVHINELKLKRSKMISPNYKQGIKPSNNYLKITKKINKLMAHKSRIIEYAQHCVSKEIVEDYDIIYVRDFNSKDYIERKKAENPDMTNDDVAYLNSVTMDNAVGNMIIKLDYKSKAYNKIMYKIDKYYPCSKTCSHCGNKIEDRGDLDDKKWTCHYCNTEHALYVNSAKNILNEGKKISVTPDEYKKQIVAKKRERDNSAKQFKDRIYNVLKKYNENMEEPIMINKGKIQSISKVLDKQSTDDEIIKYIKRMTSNKKRSHIKK